MGFNGIHRSRNTFLVAGAFIGMTAAFAFTQTPIKVFILAGQSNMSGWSPTTGLPANLTQQQSSVIIYADGEINASKAKQWLTLGPDFGHDIGWFGPEVNFGKVMSDSTPGTGVTIALIKYAWGGTDLYNRWRPPSSGGTTGDLYTNMVSTIIAALAALPAQYTPTIVGMIWMQGEQDGTNFGMSNAYETNLTNLIADARRQVSIPDLPFVAGMIRVAPAWFFADIIRNAQTNVANKVVRTGVFDTQDLPYGADGYHYLTAGMVEVGRRFAITMLQVLNSAVNKPPMVEAGQKQYSVTKVYPATFNLNGSATDDGKPNSTLAISWEKAVGSGTATFGNIQNPVTTVTLSQRGAYRLRLNANDGAVNAMDAVSIVVDTVLNLAIIASSDTTSYCSPWETLYAINDGADPANSNDKNFGAYGNWPQTGTQWVQYNWSSPVNPNKIDVYWFDDGGGVRVPASCVLRYWNGTGFSAVTGASGYGVAANRYNTTTFNQMTTTRLRLEFTSSGTPSTGVLEWKVYGTAPSSVRSTSVAAMAGIAMSVAGNAVRFSLPPSERAQPLTLQLFDLGGRVVSTLLNTASKGGKYTAFLCGNGRYDHRAAQGVYIARLQYGTEAYQAVINGIQTVSNDR